MRGKLIPPLLHGKREKLSRSRPPAPQGKTRFRGYSLDKLLWIRETLLGLALDLKEGAYIIDDQSGGHGALFDLAHNFDQKESLSNVDDVSYQIYKELDDLAINIEEESFHKLSRELQIDTVAILADAIHAQIGASPDYKS
jgi:hypothetical protein